MRLSRKTIDRLPRTVKRPHYDLGTVTVGIVHLGIGAFHRAHQAVYTDGLLSEDPSWGICGVSLRSPETRDALHPQDGLYTLAVQDGEGSELSVVGSVVELLCAPDDPEAVLRRMADPGTRIVSLTITEKGYCHNPATGTLDEGHPDIVHDLANPARPRSAIGFIVEAISRRVSAGIAPFTLLSCDNLPGNGHVLKRIVTQFAEARDPALAAVVRNVASPSTMVDRIVPATTDSDRSAVASAMGLEDAWPIMTEPFRQWVIEEDFPLGRPAWEKAGALFVQDVSAFEFMKLRLLNGSHSTLAYLGYLAGAETVADAMALAGMEALVEGLMRHEVSPTLPELPASTFRPIGPNSFSAFAILRFATAPGRSPWTARRSCRSASSARSATACRQGPAMTGWRSGLPPGCAMRAAWTRRAVPSTCAIRMLPGSPALRGELTSRIALSMPF